MAAIAAYTLVPLLPEGMMEMAAIALDIYAANNGRIDAIFITRLVMIVWSKHRLLRMSAIICIMLLLTR